MTKYAARDLTLAIDGTPIGQCTAIGKIGANQELIDASAYGDEWKDFVLGQKDGAEVAVTLALDPTDGGAVALEAAWDGDPHTFTLAHADNSYDKDFEALVTTVMTGGDRDGLLEMEASLKIVNPGVTDGS